MTTTAIERRIDRFLDERSRDGLFRCLPGVRTPVLDLSNNSYLGLEHESSIQSKALAGIDRHLEGNLASRLVSERSELYHHLENELASWKHSESALVFNSGYAANLGILQALCTRDTEIYCDRLNHASILDGIKLSGAKLIRYRHCDMNDLERKLQHASKPERLIVTDTVFSMDGDIAPLDEIVSLAERFGCMTMVDEAHGAGLFGDNRSGVVEMMNLEGRVAIRVGTLSKSLAGLGGFFAGSSRIRDYLVNGARSLIYSTALPRSVLAWNIAALDYVRDNPERASSVLQRAHTLRTGLQALGFSTGNSCSQIVPCIVGSPEAACSLSSFLLEQGVLAPAIRPPTVPSGTARVRFSINAAVTPSDIDRILSLLPLWRSQQ